MKRENLKVGDKVIIGKECKHWVGWVDELNGYVGKTVTIHSFRNTDFRITDNWNFPYEAIKCIEKDNYTMY